MVKQPRYVKVKQSLRFVVDWAIPDAEGIVKWDDLVAYFQDRIKVKGKAGVLGDDVKVTREKAKLIVTSEIEMSKRYIKYLTKKFLQKYGAIEYFKPVASPEDKDCYVIKYRPEMRKNEGREVESDEDEDEVE